MGGNRSHRGSLKDPAAINLDKSTPRNSINDANKNKILAASAAI